MKLILNISDGSVYTSNHENNARNGIFSNGNGILKLK